MAREMNCLDIEIAGRRLGKLCVPLLKERGVITKHLILSSSDIETHYQKRPDTVFRALEEKPIRKTFEVIRLVSAEVSVRDSTAFHGSLENQNIPG